MHKWIAPIFLFSVFAQAKMVEKTVDYKIDSASYSGFLAYDDAHAEKKPGVLIIHDWLGLTDKTKDKARKIAKLGYVALAADIYGKGVRADNPKDAGALAGKYKGDRALYRKHLTAALNELKKQSQVDTKKIAAIGFCFGGTGVAELARSGADVLGVVSFHGGLDSPTPADGKNIKSKVLALHGADDPYVPAADLAAFEKELVDAKVDYQLVKYGGAVHSFTDKTAGTDNSKGAAYNEKADKRSWVAMQNFLKEIF